MKNFSEEIKTYALSNGFEEIKEVDITPPDLKLDTIVNPEYIILFRKSVKATNKFDIDSTLWIVIYKVPPVPGTISIRICFTETRYEYCILVSNFIKYGSPVLDMEIELAYKNVMADLLNKMGLGRSSILDKNQFN